MTKYEILVNALKEYEENHYMDYGISWQKNINQLIVEAEDKKRKSKNEKPNKAEKHETYLLNAIEMLLDECYEDEEIARELGMTDEEYIEITGRKI